MLIRLAMRLAFCALALTFWNSIHTHGVDWVKKSLHEWLCTATKQGSGDDITLGILYHPTIAAVQPSPLEDIDIKQTSEGVVAEGEPVLTSVTAPEETEKEPTPPLLASVTTSEETEEESTSCSTNSGSLPPSW